MILINARSTCYLIPVSRNQQGRSTTADIGDILLPSLMVLGCSLTAVEVYACPLFDVILPSFLLPCHLSGLEIRGILVANATMFSHLLPGFSCGSKHLLLP